jgi:pyridoxamine 5'-phosphate oxidase
MSYHKARKDYTKHMLVEADCPSSPFKLLDEWLLDAHSESEDANAFTLSTVNENGQPSSRIVLLRSLTELGVVFYTNYDSQKGNEMSQNPMVSINFFWPWIERQVRIGGNVTKVPSEISDAYFKSRPRKSQIGAIASAQSKELKVRETLENRVIELTSEFEGRDIPRPENWGGYIVTPSYFEFWQGRASRLHDRIRYDVLAEDYNWSISRLYP